MPHVGFTAWDSDSPRVLSVLSWSHVCRPCMCCACARLCACAHFVSASVRPVVPCLQVASSTVACWAWRKVRRLRMCACSCLPVHTASVSRDLTLQLSAAAAVARGACAYVRAGRHDEQCVAPVSPRARRVCVQLCCVLCVVKLRSVLQVLDRLQVV